MEKKTTNSRNKVIDVSLFRKVAEKLDAAVAIHELIRDPTGNPVDYTFLYANPSFDRHTGLKGKKIVGKRVTECLPGIEKSGLIKDYGNVVDSGEPIVFDLYSEQLKRHFTVNAFALGGDCFAAIFNDITEKYVLEQYKHELEKLVNQHTEELAEQHSLLQDLERQRDAAVHMLIHDMRNPLQVILSNLLALRRHIETLQDQSEDLEALESSIYCTETLKRMICDVLDLRHMQQKNLNLDLEKLDASKLVDAAHAQTWDPNSKRGFVSEIDSTCPPVFCDSELTVRILSNLIANAVKYSPSKSTVTMGVREDGNQIRIWVHDQGPGIHEEHKDKIFNFLETLSKSPKKKTDSYGIGLAFCKSAVEVQGGRIGVESIPGEGSTFWIDLPAYPKA